jgi:hypothetical protein
VVLLQVVKGAVEHGALWAINGSVSLWSESVPDGVLTAAAQLNPPPDPIGVFDVLADRIPHAWNDGSTTVLAISAALSNLQGRPLPCPVVRQAITEARNAGLITIDADNVSWPCALSEAGSVRLRIPQGIIPSPPVPAGRRIRSERTLKLAEIQNFADTVGELVAALRSWSPEIHVAVEIDLIRNPLDAETITHVNEVLGKVSNDWKIEIGTRDAH